MNSQKMAECAHLMAAWDPHSLCIDCRKCDDTCAVCQEATPHILKCIQVTKRRKEARRAKQQRRKAALKVDVIDISSDEDVDILGSVDDKKKVKKVDFELLPIPFATTIRKDLYEWDKMRQLAVSPVSMTDLVDLQPYLTDCSHYSLKMGCADGFNPSAEGILMLYFSDRNNVNVALVQLKSVVKPGVEVMRRSKQVKDFEFVHKSPFSMNILDHGNSDVVFIGNLPPTATEEALSKIFTEAYIRMSPNSGYAYAFYVHSHAAMHAVNKHANHASLDGHLLAVEIMSKVTADLSEEQVASLRKRKKTLMMALCIIKDNDKQLSEDFRTKIGIIEDKLIRHRERTALNAPPPPPEPTAVNPDADTTPATTKQVDVPAVADAATAAKTKQSTPKEKKKRRDTTERVSPPSGRSKTPKGILSRMGITAKGDNNDARGQVSARDRNQLPRQRDGRVQASRLPDASKPRPLMGFVAQPSSGFMRRAEHRSSSSERGATRRQDSIGNEQRQIGLPRSDERRQYSERTHTDPVDSRRHSDRMQTAPSRDFDLRYGKKRTQTSDLDVRYQKRMQTSPSRDLDLQYQKRTQTAPSGDLGLLYQKRMETASSGDRDLQYQQRMQTASSSNLDPQFQQRMQTASSGNLGPQFQQRMQTASSGNLGPQFQQRMQTASSGNLGPQFQQRMQTSPFDSSRNYDDGQREHMNFRQMPAERFREGMYGNSNNSPMLRNNGGVNPLKRPYSTMSSAAQGGWSGNQVSTNYPGL